MTIKNSLFFILLYLSAFAQNSWVPQISGVTTSLVCTKVVDQNVAWAAGDSGKVIRTVNGGITWTSVDDGNFGDATIWNIDALDSSTAFITTTSLPLSTTYIYRTTNGGGSWEQVFFQDGGFINDIHMINNTSGVAYGDPVDGKWTVIKTYDGGLTWSRISTEPTPDGFEVGMFYNSLSLTDSLHIWFLGTNKVYRSFDGGATWASSVAPSDFTSIWFNSITIGMASSGSNAFLSIDSGKTWSNGLKMGDYYSMAGSGTKDFWYASGPNVFHTSDFGLSWSEETIVMNGQFFAMDFVTIGTIAYGYVAGTNGLIARYQGIISSIDKNYPNPSKFILDQNYPNPFNPNTTINYEIPIQCNVTLKIYDLLGNEILTLVDGNKSAGKYEIRFDASSLASGIYLYKLKAGDYSDMKKLILIK